MEDRDKKIAKRNMKSRLLLNHLGERNLTNLTTYIKDQLLIFKMHEQ